MSDFELVSVTLASANGVLVVPDARVRRRGKETFFLDSSPPSCPGSPDPLPQPAQPFSLSPAISVRDSDPKYQTALLVFNPNAIGPSNVPGWHRDAFDPCLSLVQVMQVTGVGPKDLTINLSCAVHPLSLSTQLKQAALDSASVAALLLLTRRFLRAPGPPRS